MPILTMKKRVTIVVLALIVALASVGGLLGVFSFASESYTDISTASQLKSMSSSGNYRLTANIVLNDGTTLSDFSGKLDGNGKTISGITAPLFESVSGSVTNLTVTGSIDISGKTLVGALANTLSAGAVIDGCTVNVTMNGTRPSAAMVVGGIVGKAEASSEIKNSANRGNITVTGAYNAENENAMGGIVGFLSNGAKVEYSANYGVIYANGNGNTADFKGAVGGIVGRSAGETYITGCLNAGTVKAVSSKLCIGGILGRTETDNSANPNITYCANTGAVEKTSDIGERAAGIASYVRGGNVKYNYNTGKISSDNSDVCGIIGYYNGSGATLYVQYNYNAGELSSSQGKYAIMRVNGMGNLKPAANYFISTYSACNEGLASTVSCTNAADLTSKVIAACDSFCSDMSGSASVNSGYPIQTWQCDHSFDTENDADLGIICSNCNKVIAENDCSHTFGSWTVAEEAKENEDGLKTRTCTKCGAVDKEVIPATTSFTPVNVVYSISSSAQLIWVVNNLNSGNVPADASIKLTANIDVASKLATVTVTFTGELDGNSKTVSGISNTLFKQFNGTVKNLTIKGDIDVSASTVDHDTARKAASFALSSEGASFENLISYVNIKTNENDLNAGGIVGYAKTTNTFIGCKYLGEYTVAWAGDGAGIGGIVGWSNAGGGATTFNECEFGGKITVTNGASGKEAYIGGILGNCTNASVIIKRCVNNGTILSEIKNGTDFVGGIVGINKNSGTVISSSVNKGSVTGVKNAGGIIGGITTATKISACANYAKVTASACGAIAGTSNSNTLTISSSADFSKNSLKLCPSSFTNENSYEQSKINSTPKTITFGGVKYDRYNIGFVENETGIMVETMSTSEKFTPYITLKEENGKGSVRFLILSKPSIISNTSVTVKMTFKDADGKTVKSLSKKLALENSDFELYSAVLAGGEKFFAAEGNAFFGCIINDIPANAWNSVELTITDTTTGSNVMTPSVFDLDTLKGTIEMLPDLSTLGNVSASIYNCGPGLVSDEHSTTDEDSYMAVISATTAAKLKTYLTNLESSGYEFISKTTVDGDDYYTYKKYGTLFYFYHNTRTRTTRVIADNSSDQLSEICYEDKTANGEVVFYQYSINYTNADKAGYDPVTYSEPNAVINCGMLYVIKLADNKLIVVDGGHENQSTVKSREGFMKFLREITGKGEDEKVDIAMWYFTHAHGDHVRFARDVLLQFRKEINLDSITYNFPSYQVLSGGYDSNTFLLKQTINNYYKDVKFHKLHTGEVLNFPGVTMDVVFTHEDLVTNAGTASVGDFNSTSTVLKINIGGETIMLLGDISGQAESTIVAMHKPAYLKSDIVQATHHCFNYLDSLYPLIAAEIAIFPQSKYNCANTQNDGGNLGKYQSIMKYATEEYFAHKYTYAFVVKNGKFVATALPRYDAE